MSTTLSSSTALSHAQPSNLSSVLTSMEYYGFVPQQFDVLDSEFLHDYVQANVWTPEKYLPKTYQGREARVWAIAHSTESLGSIFVSTPYFQITSETPVLKQLFVYQDFWAVDGFLRGKPALRQLLFETYLKLREYFNDDAQFILEVSRDVYEPADEELYLWIQSKSSLRRKLDTLNRFEIEWWFERTGYFVGSPVVMLR